MRPPNTSGKRQERQAARYTQGESSVSEAQPPPERWSPEHGAAGFELYRCFPLAMALKTAHSSDL